MSPSALPVTTPPRRIGRAVSRAAWGALALFCGAFAVVEVVNHGVYALIAVVVLAIAPDVTMVIDAGGGRLGPKAVPFSNAAHRPWVPLALLVIFPFTPFTWPPIFAAGLAWLTHIAIDRAFGYGLRAADGSRRG